VVGAEIEQSLFADGEELPAMSRTFVSPNGDGSEVGSEVVRWQLVPTEVSEPESPGHLLCRGGGGGPSDDPGGGDPGDGNSDDPVDETGSGEVRIVVGARTNGGYFGFDPDAVRVSPGTTVTWEWSGRGGEHNVVHEGGEFESELTDEEGHTFSHTFDAAGTYDYVCSPHREQGMTGTVIVEE